MTSGIGHIICNAICDICTHFWTAVVEVEYIDFGENIDYKKPKNLQCPNCMGETETYEVIENK